MAKKKNPVRQLTDDGKDTGTLDFKAPVTALKKSAEDIRGYKSPLCKVYNDIPIPIDKLKDIRDKIYNLEKGQCVEVTNENTGLTIVDLQKRTSNIIINHKKKFIQKEFIVKKIDDITIRVWRNQ